MGTLSVPVPVTGLAVNFSPMPRTAPPPVGRFNAGGEMKNESCFGSRDASGEPDANGCETLEFSAESPTLCPNYFVAVCRKQEKTESWGKLA
jgi:hypothetical protein